MALPKISIPTYFINIPSLNKKVLFRAMLVKEEKLLLMAKESDEEDDILLAIKQVVNNCLMDNSIDIDKLAIFDIEYVFLNIRSFSVGSKIKVSYKDNDDNVVRDFEIDINDIKVKFPEFHDFKKPYTIKLNNEMYITLKYPPSTLYSEKIFKNLTENEALDLLMINCLDKIYDGDKVTDFSVHSKEEILEFINSLDISTFEKIKDFILNTPKLEYCIEYVNNNGKERKIVLNSLSDFFMLR